MTLTFHPGMMAVPTAKCFAPSDPVTTFFSFVWHEAQRSPLQLPSNGPFWVLEDGASDFCWIWVIAVSVFCVVCPDLRSAVDSASPDCPTCEGLCSHYGKLTKPLAKD